MIPFINHSFQYTTIILLQQIEIDMSCDVGPLRPKMLTLAKETYEPSEKTYGILCETNIFM